MIQSVSLSLRETMPDNIFTSTAARQIQPAAQTRAIKAYMYAGNGAHPNIRCTPPPNSQKTAKVDRSFREYHTSIR